MFISNIKSTLAFTLYHLGLLKLILSVRKKSIILGYHHILPENDERVRFLQPGMFVTTKTFEEQLKYLVKYYQIVSFKDLNLNGRKKQCILTFDDGWGDNYEYAYPILKKYNLPATIFVSTKFVGSNDWPWPDRISYYIHKSNADKLSQLLDGFNLLYGDTTKVSLNKNSISNKYNLIEEIIENLKTFSPSKIIQFMSKADKIMSSEKTALSEIRPYLTWDEIIEMQKNDIAFGAHTHNHLILTNTTLNNASDEIETSQKILSEKLNMPINLFAYPNGSYNSDLVILVKKTGFAYAVTTEYGDIEGSRSQFELKRILVHQDVSKNVPLFVSRLTYKIPKFRLN
jgi:peptidoglycan/xylan/chitin deacetylase (PgdA/CDA1 family)